MTIKIYMSTQKKKAKIWVIVVTDGIGVRQMVSEIVFIYRLHILS